MSPWVYFVAGTFVACPLWLFLGVEAGEWRYRRKLERAEKRHARELQAMADSIHETGLEDSYRAIEEEADALEYAIDWSAIGLPGGRSL